MLISGMWHACDDGVLRPVIAAEVQARDGAWIKALCLVDTGADRTVLSADILTALRFPPPVAEDRIGGIGGVVSTVLVDTVMRLSHENNGKVIFRGQYAAVTEAVRLDISVLGRDITNLFATLVDWPQRVVYLIGQRHQYTITPQA
jgi:predicted aspartyl protease